MIIRNARIFDGEMFLHASQIQFKNGMVAAIGKACGPDAEVLDAGERLLVPGYIDLHMHGLMGYDILDCDAACVQAIANEILVNGTTAFLPSVPTGTTEEMRNTLLAIKSAMGSTSGARILGAHLEGQIISPAARGAHSVELLKSPTVENYKQLAKGAEDVVRRVTMAPELEGGMELVSHLASLGIVVSAGHTTADGDVFTEAVDRGLTSCTHFLNGMARFNHREMNVISRALVDDRVFIEFIPDLRHISSDAIEIIFRCKERKSFICTDSTAPAGLPDGDYSFKTGEFHLQNGVAIRPDNGSLSGSTISMQEGVKRLSTSTSLPLASILQMATSTPAEVIGHQNIGNLRVGSFADALLLDADLSVSTVIQAGHVVRSNLKRELK